MARERRPLGLLVEPWNPQEFAVGKLPPVTGHPLDLKGFRDGVGEHLSQVTVLKPLKFLSHLIGIDGRFLPLWQELQIVLQIPETL